jgi:FAD/FMN-containing dehydrogenase
MPRLRGTARSGRSLVGPMDAGASQLDRVVDRLRGELDRDRILEGPQAAKEVQRRSLNPGGDVAPQYLLRPQNTKECRVVVAALSSIGCYPNPIGALTTFWEPHPIGSGVGVDTLGLREPCRIDRRERVGYFGAGITVREVDRFARARGLCLVAYPDSDGETSVGSMAAVASTTGLGLGRMPPVEQIVGLTIVTPDATVVKTGASWRFGRGGLAHGIPDPSGVFLGSQGRFGVITEVVLTLAPAPFLAARSWCSPWAPPDEVASQLRRARQRMDHGTVDSLRLETVCAGREQPSATEWFLRCWALVSAEVADKRCAALAQSLAARDPRGWVESAAGRRGDLPDHDARYSVPPGAHHERTGHEGFLGIEVTTNWGDQLDAALKLFAELFGVLGTLGLRHRRLGIYPSVHAVSIGIQAMLSGGEASADRVRAAMAKFVEPLSALGVIPYKPGRLWREIMDQWEVGDPACAIIQRTGLFGRSQPVGLGPTERSRRTDAGRKP